MDNNQGTRKEGASEEAEIVLQSCEVEDIQHIKGSEGSSSPLNSHDKRKLEEAFSESDPPRSKKSREHNQKNQEEDYKTTIKVEARALLSDTRCDRKAGPEAKSISWEYLQRENSLDRERKNLSGLSPLPFAEAVTQWLDSIPYNDKTFSRSATQNEMSLPVDNLGGGRAPGQRTNTSNSQNMNNYTYRRRNLLKNNIDMRDENDVLQDWVTNHVRGMLSDRSSPALTRDEMAGHRYLITHHKRTAGTERDVQRIFEDMAFPKALDEKFGMPAGLIRTDTPHVQPHHIPSVNRNRVTQPRPNNVYGYMVSEGPDELHLQRYNAAARLHPTVDDFDVIGDTDLCFPFLAIEYKGSGNTNGNMYKAFHQAAGAATACLTIPRQLNRTLLQNYDGDPSNSVEGDNEQRPKAIEPIVYSFSIDPRDAIVCVAWMEWDYNIPMVYFQEVESYRVANNEHMQHFRKVVRNILEWAKGPRRIAICDALRIINARGGPTGSMPPTAPNSGISNMTGSKRALSADDNQDNQEARKRSGPRSSGDAA